MRLQGIIGIVLLVIGLILLFVGINASNSLADEVSETFRGRLTDGTMWYLIGGVGASLGGLLLIIFGVRGKGS